MGLYWSMIQQVTGVAPAPSFPVSGLTSYWRFDEEGGTIAYDAMGAVNGTANNSRVLGNTGMENNSADFSQGNDYIDLGADSKAMGKLLDEFSMSYWIKSDEITSSSEIYYIATIDSAKTYKQYLQFGFFQKDMYFLILRTGVKRPRYDNIVDDGDWHHCVFTYSMSDSQTYKFYVDGVAQTKNSSSAADSTLSSFTADFDYNITMGARNLRGVIDSYSNVELDEFAFYDRAITAAEVTAIYNSGAGTYYPIPSETLPVTSGLTVWFGNNVANVDKNVMTDGTIITQWDDQSGNDWHLTGTTGNYPHYSTGNTSISALGVGSTKEELLYNKDINTLTGSTNSTIFFVVKKTSVDAYDRFWSLGNNSSDGYAYSSDLGSGTKLWSMFTGSRKEWTPLFLNNETALLTYLNTGTTNTDVYMRRDGDEMTNTSTTDPTQTSNVQKGFIIGSAFSNTSYDIYTDWNSSNDWMEIIMYNRVLSTAEIESVEAYLSTKYWLGLTHYWKFDETSGTTPVDSVGSLNGSSNATISTSGISENCLSFGLASNTSVSLGNDAFASADVVSGSVSMWIKTSTTPSTSQAVVKLFSMEGWINIGLADSTGYFGAVTSGSGLESAYAFGSTDLTDGEWHHCVTTWNASLTTIYVDGEFVDDIVASNSPLPSTTSGRATRFGNSWNFGYDDDYVGLIDEIGMWNNKELTADEVAALYNDGDGKFYNE